MRGIYSQALLQHELENNESYYINELSNETKRIIYDYYTRQNTIIFKI